MTQIPTQVTFRGLAANDVIEAEIHERVAWLEHFFTGIVRCRVLVEVPHRHHRDGRHFHIRLEVTIPREAPIVISREPSLHGALRDVEDDAHSKDTEIGSVHQHASVALRDAFDAARRKLEDLAREQRGAVKVHAMAAP